MGKPNNFPISVNYYRIPGNQNEFPISGNRICRNREMRNKCIFDHSPYSIVIRLTHWGRVTHICVNKLTIIGSDNGLSPDRRQAITWTSDGILLIGPIGTSFSETLSKIQTFSLKKMRFKVSSAKWRPFCLDLNVLSWSSPLWPPCIYWVQ